MALPIDPPIRRPQLRRIYHPLIEERIMAAQEVNLLNLFQTVSKALSSSKEALNQADTYNHDHGDNMVQVFDTVAEAMKAKKGASPADQLAYASELLRQRQSGSAKYYAGGLSRAAQQFTGQPVTTENAMQLVQTLLGGEQPVTPATGAPSGQGDLLGSLLSGLTGAAGPQAPAQADASPGIDVGDLLNAGLSFLDAKQAGASDANALLGALTAATQGGNTPYRAQSGAVVANALMQAIGSLANK
jgi:hypothetical protein